MTMQKKKQAYEKPDFSSVLLEAESVTLTGSLEPIEGNDDPDVTW